MAINTADTSALSTDEGVRRRDWIHIAALSTAGVGGASLLFPLISQMAPSEDVLAASSTVSVPAKRGTSPLATPPQSRGLKNKPATKPIAIIASKPMITRSKRSWLER